MSTAIAPHDHHHRTQLIGAGAAVLAVVAAGVIFETTRDTGSAAPTAPAGSTSVQKFDLRGNDHQDGHWKYAGTASGGQTMVSP